MLGQKPRDQSSVRIIAATDTASNSDVDRLPLVKGCRRLRVGLCLKDTQRACRN
jgi:hypothetical protein